MIAKLAPAAIQSRSSSMRCVRKMARGRSVWRKSRLLRSSHNCHRVPQIIDKVPGGPCPGGKHSNSDCWLGLGALCLLLDLTENPNLRHLFSQLLPMDGAAAVGGSGQPTANGEKLQEQQFDPSRMIGIIKRKALIKELAAAYHAECVACCKELLQLQRKWEEEQCVEAKVTEEPTLVMKPSKRRKK